ncbi:hypothetical protein [Pontibacterium sp.]|uniref:hypothetical protein n=1 Tax=Pontibacterium sp. TaxID=2036026 RepID=UPI003567D7C4
MSDMKQRIDKLVQVFVNYSLSPDQDAGWHAPPRPEWTEQQAKRSSASFRVRQMTAAFKSCDEKQANDSSDRKMMDEIRYLRRKHHDYNLAVMLLSRLPEKYAEAILAEPYLRGVYKKPFTDISVSKELCCPVHRYRHAKKMAYKGMTEALAIIDDYESCRREVA